MSAEPTASEAVPQRAARTQIRGLRRRFVVAISTLVALVLVAQATVLVYFGYRHLETEIEQRALSYAELAVGPISRAYTDYAASGVGKFHEIVLETANLNPALKALVIYNTAGESLFHSDDLGQDGRASGLRYLGATLRQRPLKAELGHEIRRWIEVSPTGERYFVVLAPHLEEWGSFRHAVVFYFSYDGLHTAMWGIGWQIVGLASLALALGVGCAYLLSAQSLVPVEKLTAGARRLAEGKLVERIGLRTGDEFEVLGATLDQMAERLQTTIGDLETSNERLNRLIEELKELDRVKGNLLANVSHELRTPLTTISGYVETMGEGMLGPLSSTQRESLEIVERNIRRLRTTIDQLLSYSRMSSGTIEVELRPFELEPVIRHVVEALTSIHGRTLHLECEVQPDLPQAYGDAASLTQVFENLLTNAVKFSPAGGRIRLTVQEVAGGIETAVADEGIGIPAGEQERIFERFYQVDADANRKFGGMGLGLAIVREILELNHSEIHLESRPGAGSTFRFVLPVAADRSGMIPLHGWHRVALIDDDVGFIQQMAAHLSSRGFVVDTAATAEQGYALVRRVRPDVILLDRLLPDGDGFDLLTRFKEDEKTREIPVFIVTVRPEKALGMRLGAAGYLVKPVAAVEVEGALRKQLATPGANPGTDQRPE
ncbi:MAG: response regulator [bacterium]|nr:response regulator [bacterium]